MTRSVIPSIEREIQRQRWQKVDPDTGTATVVTYEVSSTAVTYSAPAMSSEVSGAKKARQEEESGKDSTGDRKKGAPEASEGSSQDVGNQNREQKPFVRR